MKMYYFIPILIYLIIPAILIVAIIYSYKRKSRIFRYIVWIPVFIFGMFIGAIVGNELGDVRNQLRKANEASNLIECSTLIRDGEIERGTNALDGEINWRLKVSAWGKDMEELPEETHWAWQKAKVYYAKYNIVGNDYTNDANLVRNKLEDVPWPQHIIDKKTFEEKYKTDTLQIAPELDISQWAGPSLSLDELRGKVVLLDFWGLGCKPCITTLPKVQQLHDKFEEQDLVIIAIHAWGGSFEKISEFVKKNNYSFTVGVDAGQTVRNYAVFGIPSYYLINKDGCLAWGPEHEIPSEEQIKSLLQE